MERGGDEITEHDEITRKYSSRADNDTKTWFSCKFSAKMIFLQFFIECLYNSP